MNDEEPYPLKELFKYRPKNNNSTICASALIGKIPLKPERTKFKIGIYLTSYKGSDSRYLEDVLSIGYTPRERRLIDINDLNPNFVLFNNKDEKIKDYSNVAELGHHILWRSSYQRQRNMQFNHVFPFLACLSILDRSGFLAFFFKYIFKRTELF